MIKKIFFVFIIICLTFSFPVIAQQTVLQGSVMYNVESARKYAFEGLDLKIDKSRVSMFGVTKRNPFLVSIQYVALGEQLYVHSKVLLISR